MYCKNKRAAIRAIRTDANQSNEVGLAAPKFICDMNQQWNIGVVKLWNVNLESNSRILSKQVVKTNLNCLWWIFNIRIQYYNHKLEL